MLAALGEADGVVGVIPANAFLDDAYIGTVEPGEPLTLEAVGRHLDHMAAIVGWDRVGIGSDLDGGFGVEETPVELDTVADLHGSATSSRTQPAPACSAATGCGSSRSRCPRPSTLDPDEDRPSVRSRSTHRSAPARTTCAIAVPT